MTEQEWLACTDPGPMLQYLRRGVVTLVDEVPGERREIMKRHLLRIVNPRKVFFFGCACCRLLWPLLKDKRSRKAVEVTESYIDGLVDFKEWMAAANDSMNARDAIVTSPKDVNRTADQVVRAATIATMKTALLDVEGAAVESAVAITWSSLGLTFPEAEHDQARLLHDIVGNPFQPVTLDPAWLTPTVVSLAQEIYEDCAYDRLPLLTDVLEIAGCDNAEVLAHCRGPGPHVRGCWVVDLLLSRSWPENQGGGESGGRRVWEPEI